MAVIWGLDLAEIQFSKFKSSHMFSREYHLRRTKMIVYQIAMILCVCSESVGTAAITDYVDQQNAIVSLDGRASVFNNDFVGAASYNIFVGVAVATIFGSAFFFDLFWPERTESKAVRLAWKISAVVVTIAALADALALTVIVARNGSVISGVDSETVRMLLQQRPHPAILYRHYAKSVAAVVLLWPGFVATVASTIILFASHKHDDQFGPKSIHAQRKDEEKTRSGASRVIAF